MIEEPNELVFAEFNPPSTDVAASIKRRCEELSCYVEAHTPDSPERSTVIEQIQSIAEWSATASLS